MIQSTIENRKL